jgi:hypothetical protein
MHNISSEYVNGISKYFKINILIYNHMQTQKKETTIKVCLFM